MRAVAAAFSNRSSRWTASRNQSEENSRLSVRGHASPPGIFDPHRARVRLASDAVPAHQQHDSGARERGGLLCGQQWEKALRAASAQPSSPCPAWSQCLGDFTRGDRMLPIRLLQIVPATSEGQIKIVDARSVHRVENSFCDAVKSVQALFLTFEARG